MAYFTKDTQPKRPKNFFQWLVHSDPITRQIPLPQVQLPWPELPVLVIGAGPAGLATMQALKSAGIFFTGVEQSSGVGGLWNPANPQSAAYDDLITISSKITTRLDDPMPRAWPAYLSREKALIYLQDFAARHQLRDQIRFNTCLTAVNKTSRGTWMATLSANGQAEKQEFRAIVNAAGTLNRSNQKYPQDLWGQAQRSGIPTIHTADYKNSRGYEGKNILIIGVGNSAAEIATQMSRVARKVFLAVRTPPWIVPLWAFGIPSDVFARTFGLPHSLRMMLFHPIQRWYIGHPTRLGFAAPQHDLLDVVPVCNRGFAEAIRLGKIEVRPTVQKIQAGRVSFKSPLAESPAALPEPIDQIIFATGYTKNYSFLPPEFGNLDDPQFKLAFQLFHPHEPGLMTLPALNVQQGIWPIFFKQAQTIAAYFQAEVNHPARFQNFLARCQALPPDYKGRVLQAADDYSVDAETYLRLLRDLTTWLKDPSPITQALPSVVKINKVNSRCL